MLGDKEQGAVLKQKNAGFRTVICWLPYDTFYMVLRQSKAEGIGMSAWIRRHIEDVLGLLQKPPVRPLPPVPPTPPLAERTIEEIVEDLLRKTGGELPFELVLSQIMRARRVGLVGAKALLQETYGPTMAPPGVEIEVQGDETYWRRTRAPE